MKPELRVFVTSVQNELEDERLMVQSLLNTDSFLSAHCLPVLYDFEPASPDLAITPAVEAQLNERQREMLLLLVQGEELTSRRCEVEFSVTRDTANRDFALLYGSGLRRRKAAAAPHTMS
jgi:hypothetical protein